MSKTYETQLAKAKMLVDGLKNNAEWAQKHGISTNELSELETIIAEGEKLNAEVEALQAKTREISSVANSKLFFVKQKIKTMKQEVKHNVDILDWSKFGIMDKR